MKRIRPNEGYESIWDTKVSGNLNNRREGTGRQIISNTG